MVRAYLRAIAFVLRHAITTYGMALLVIIGLALLAVVYLAYETLSPVAATWGAIILLFAVQQVVSLGRMTLRVTLIDAELRYAERCQRRGGQPPRSAGAEGPTPPAPLL